MPECDVCVCVYVCVCVGAYVCLLVSVCVRVFVCMVLITTMVLSAIFQVSDDLKYESIRLNYLICRCRNDKVINVLFRLSFNAEVIHSFCRTFDAYIVLNHVEIAFVTSI